MSKTLTYASIRAEAERPLEDRRKLVIGRDGKVVPRKHHLGTAEVDQLQAALRDGDKFPNPHNRGNYFYIVEALKQLGLDSRHSFARVKDRVRELMSDKDTRQDDGKGNVTTAWQRFIHKEARNDETGRDIDGRLLQNIEVLQRIGGMNPYGLKIMEVGTKVLKSKGAVIDLTKTGEELYVALNTDSATPINERKRVRKTVNTGTPAKATKAKKAKSKASKPKTSKPKAKKATPAPTVAADAPATTDASAEPALATA